MSGTKCLGVTDELVSRFSCRTRVIVNAISNSWLARDKINIPLTINQILIPKGGKAQIVAAW